MVAVLRLRADLLTAQASTEIHSLSGCYDEKVRLTLAESSRREAELKSMLRCMKATIKDGSKAEDYTLKAGAKFLEGTTRTILDDVNRTNQERDVDGDLAMEETYTEPHNTRTAEQIRQKLSWDLQYLITYGATELEAYDTSARELLKKYKDLLASRNNRAEGPVGYRRISENNIVTRGPVMASPSDANFNTSRRPSLAGDGSPTSPAVPRFNTGQPITTGYGSGSPISPVGFGLPSNVPTRLGKRRRDSSDGIAERGGR